jgi:hypothetical protein
MYRKLAVMAMLVALASLSAAEVGLIACNLYANVT